MLTEVTLYEEQQQSILPANADDEMVIQLWLNKGKQSPNTQDAYQRDIGMFLAFLAGKSLRQVNILDLDAYAQSLVGKPATINRRLTVVKSLFSFAHKTGYITVNVAWILDLQPNPSSLAQRILSEGQVLTMIALEPSVRNRTILRLLYLAGLRVSELVNLTWANLIERGNDQGQLHIVGKGTKERDILLRADIWQELLLLRQGSTEPEVFLSRCRHGEGSRRLGRDRITKMVHKAAERAGIHQDVSSHFLRHSCASHALERGASIALVQQTLGHASLATTSRYTHVRPGASIADFLPK